MSHRDASGSSRLKGRVKLSAIIACYRDAPAVPFMHARLTHVFQKLGVDYEIIFVNDASPDDARQVLSELAEKDGHVVVINHTRNFGSQSAFTSGLQVATGDAAVLLDGDLQDPPELIEELFEKWGGGYDVVYGVRVGRDATKPFEKAPGSVKSGGKLLMRRPVLAPNSIEAKDHDHSSEFHPAHPSHRTR